MEIKTLELSGWVGIKNKDDENDVYLTPKDEMKEKDEYYWYPSGPSIGEAVMTHFTELRKPVVVDYSDWTQGEYLEYQDVFCRYFVADQEMTWDEANEAHIKKMAGALEVQEELKGYSEYTVTGSWTNLFVGGHDLRKELAQYEGQFVIVRIDYKV